MPAMPGPSPVPALIRPPALTDAFGRRIDYLRVSVTDRCDLRCSYCMPRGFSGFEEPANWLSFEQIERVVGAFVRLGVGRVRLTGGEPLLRRNLPELAARLKALPGLNDLSLSTNATQLARHALALRQAGVDRLNISLDSLDSACNARITGRSTLDTVLRGIDSAVAAGFAPIKLNMVAMKGVNEHEIERMAEFALAQRLVLRLIEAMPMGDTGRSAQFLDLQPVRERLIRRFDLHAVAQELGGGPARYWMTPDGAGQIGFITALSQCFCASCNRVRLGVEGTLYLCLGQSATFDFAPLLRDNVSDAELDAAIHQAIALKPENHDFNAAPHQVMRFMSQTGG